jgi:1,4-dihydroxy-6-naphthoate synthase
MEQRFPVTKVSFFCLGHILDHYVMLPSGAALGHACGPKIIAKEPYAIHDLPNLRIAIPGIHTTAHLLLDLLLELPVKKVFCLYHEIGALIRNNIVDCGLIIHESRFTFAREGYHEIADLGLLWENRFQCPIPLGCIAAKRSLGNGLLKNISENIQASLLWAWSHPKASESYIQAHSMEKDANVVKEHIHLYVNKETESVSSEGLKSIEILFSEAQKRKLIPPIGKDWYFAN